MCLSHSSCQNMSRLPSSTCPRHPPSPPSLFHKREPSQNVSGNHKNNERWQIYCKAITQIVKRHETTDGHKIMNHSKSHERSEKFERTTTKIMNPTKSWAVTETMNQYKNSFCWGSYFSWWFIVVKVRSFCEVYTFVVVYNFVMSHNFCDDSRFLWWLIFLVAVIISVIVHFLWCYFFVVFIIFWLLIFLWWFRVFVMVHSFCDGS